MTAVQDAGTRSHTQQAPTVIVSCDTHVGPTMEQLRPYCEAKYLDDFDSFVATLHDKTGTAGEFFETSPECVARVMGSQRTAGHTDMQAAMRDYDGDGVAAAVLFHGSTNGQPIPFERNLFVFDPAEAELRAAGQRIYNRWLADACADSAGRQVGLAQIPIWDVEATVKELRWAKDAGLGGVNFPAMRNDLPEYNLPHWDPLWTTAEELALPLVNHGGGSPQGLRGPGGIAFIEIENGEFFGRRAAWWLIFSGVFERHPGLRLVLTEQPGAWFTDVGSRLDSVYFNWAASHVQNYLPLLPSEYMKRQVFIGASFLAHYEAVDAVENGYSDNVMWGSDYPHAEGTWRYPETEDEVGLYGRAAMRMTFADVPEDAVRAMAGGNAIRLFGLDPEPLRKIADLIGAPSPAELAEGLDELPPDAQLSHAFRTRGPWS